MPTIFLPQDPVVIAVFPHRSLLDGPRLAFAFNRQVLFGVDPDYSLCEPWRSLLLTIGAITGCSMVPMQPGSSQGLRTMLRSLRSGPAGRSVCLFPQGGIDTLTDHDGARWLARTAGVPLMRVDLDHGPGARKVRWPSVRRYAWTSTSD